MESIQESLELPHAETQCEHCNAYNHAEKKFCSQCSFPVGGTDEEQRSFRLIISSRKRLLSDAEDKVKSAKIIIYVLAGIFFVFGLITWFSNEDFATLIVNLFMSLLYLIFAAWCSKNPFPAILSAFVIYVTLQVVNAFVDPTTIASGIIIKVIFIVALIKGIRSAREAEAYMSELQKFKAVQSGSI